MEFYEREFLTRLLCAIVNDLDDGLNRNESGMCFIEALKVLGDIGPTPVEAFGNLGPTPVEAFGGFGPLGFGSLRAIFNIPWKSVSVNFWLHGFVAWSNDINIGPRLWHSPLTMTKALKKMPSANPSMYYT